MEKKNLNSPLISVILPTFNRANYLSECIESVLKQTYGNIQFIIVDDGSTDGTEEVIRTYNDKRIEYYRLEKNKNICFALNYGLEKVRGQFIARIDSDDVFELEKLEKQLLFLYDHPECKICFTKIRVIDENSKDVTNCEKDFYKIFDVPNYTQAELLSYFFFKHNCFAHDAVLMEASIIEAVGGYNLCYVQLQDFDLWLRIAKQYPIYLIDEPLIKIRRFFKNPKQNISAQTWQIHIRTSNEYNLIRRHYFEQMDNDLFVQTFKMHFINIYATTEEAFECEKAFLLLSVCPELGIEKLEQLLNRSKYLDILERDYNFGLNDFYKLNSEIILSDEWQRATREQTEQKQKELVSCNEELQQQIKDIYASTSWKISAPIRWLGSLLSLEKRNL